MKLPSRKYVYVMTIWSASGLPMWLAKPGFSVDADYRAADVERSIWQITGEKVSVRPFFRVKVWMWAGIERTLLGLVRRLKSRRFQGASGWTEVCHAVNPIAGLLAGMLGYGMGMQCPVWLGLCVSALPWPLDLALCLVLLLVIELALILGGLYGLLWIISGGIALL